jgi:hypothetical protein
MSDIWQISSSEQADARLVSAVVFDLDAEVETQWTQLFFAVASFCMNFFVWYCLVGAWSACWLVVIARMGEVHRHTRRMAVACMHGDINVAY